MTATSGASGGAGPGRGRRSWRGPSLERQVALPQPPLLLAEERREPEQEEPEEDPVSPQLAVEVVPRRTPRELPAAARAPRPTPEGRR